MLAELLLAAWSGYANNARHTAESPVAAQPLNRIHWSTPVNLQPTTTNGDLDIHYGSPVITASNTVLVPVKTGPTDGFEVQAFDGATGALQYTLSSDYASPAHDWIPPYGIVLAATSHSVSGRGTFVRPVRPARAAGVRLYYPGAGGTVYFRDNPDSPTGAFGQIAFYGNAVYAANQTAFRQTVQISTPLVSDSTGNIFFGFTVSGSNPAGLVSGIARIATDGEASWQPASVALNCAPALSNDERLLYFAVTTGDLLALDSTNLSRIASIALLDPRGGPATISSDSSASPTVGPDGDVYLGVLEGDCCYSHNDRGWLLHFDALLTRRKLPGSFGWDDTASIVPASLVPSYTGPSSYLILTKYNNYADYGIGDGVNKIAVLDPNSPMGDEYADTPVQVMREVITIAGVTPDPNSDLPTAVREWCINTAAIDVPGKAAIVNNEDGVVYRWDFTTNTFTERQVLTAGRGEAYTPTVIGPDGTSYAINDGILFAVGK